ncbi:hypothetical protein CGCS363_v013207 [Colletotrichum siamense]|uniref:uncharacterized protein n=1 Tax=Colletotrichum siamense TaxID=690259 RepID=UPI0018721D52|nr:uncharacterized protein CGCS363_v013207 [Colletotrichum siamense]KAF5487041.1 hypothetical protein CGCS363_v013207 [Colletotrichum siamense]
MDLSLATAFLEGYCSSTWLRQRWVSTRGRSSGLFFKDETLRGDLAGGVFLSGATLEFGVYKCGSSAKEACLSLFFSACKPKVEASPVSLRVFALWLADGEASLDHNMAEKGSETKSTIKIPHVAEGRITFFNRFQSEQS